MSIGKENGVVRKQRVIRSKRAEVKRRLRSVKVALPPFTGWSVICIECVLADMAKSIGNGVEKRMLRMLCSIYELHKIKGFAYGHELTLLMGMDAKTVSRTLSEMTSIGLLQILERKQPIESVKQMVRGWTMTEQSLLIMGNILASWRRLTLTLEYSNEHTLNKAFALRYKANRL